METRINRLNLAAKICTVIGLALLAVSLIAACASSPAQPAAPTPTPASRDTIAPPWRVTKGGLEEKEAAQ